MTEFLQTAFIPREDVVVLRPETRLTTVDDLEAHLKSRSGLFTNKLWGIAHRSKWGWQEITVENGLVEKWYANALSPNAEYTGFGLCKFSTFALCEGLGRVAPDFIFEPVALRSDFCAENWLLAQKYPDVFGHVITRATHRPTKTQRFIDGTYGQIDHRKVGKILCVTQEELPDYYKYNNGIAPSTFYEDRATFLNWLEDRWLLTPKDYQKLVAAIF